MSIQQNINQTLSLASFVASQTPVAAARREEATIKQRETQEDIATTKAYEQAKTLYQSVSKAIEEGEEAKLIEESIEKPADLERRTERFVRAAEDYEARFGTRPELKGKPGADIVGGESYNAEEYLRRIKAEKSRRQAAEEREIDEMVEEDERIEREWAREQALVEEKRTTAANRPTTDYMTPEGRAQLQSARESAAARAKEDRIAAYKLELERLSPTKKEDKE